MCALSDRIAIRQRIHFRTQGDQKAHTLPLGNLCDPKAHKFHLGNMRETDGKINSAQISFRKFVRSIKTNQLFAQIS